MPVYRFIIRGRAANKQTWRVAGVVECGWSQVFPNVMQTSFHQLTNGNAQYGYPGLGCEGPYEITELNLELDDQ